MIALVSSTRSPAAVESAAPTASASGWPSAGRSSSSTAERSASSRSTAAIGSSSRCRTELYRSGIEASHPARSRSGLLAGAHAEFAQDPLDVRADGLGGDHELVGHLVGALALADQVEHLPLARRKRA